MDGKQPRGEETSVLTRLSPQQCRQLGYHYVLDTCIIVTPVHRISCIILISSFNILFLYTHKILLYYYEFIRFHYIVSNAFTLINFKSFLKKGILVTQFLKKRKFEFLPFLNFALRTQVNKIPACHIVLLNFWLRI